MGNQQQYLQTGGFSEYLFKDHPKFPMVEMNGIRAKAIYHISDPKGEHSRLPTSASTSDIYIKVADNVAVQAKLYVRRQMVLDFDWDHNHTNTPTGEKFIEGVVHVQTYRVDREGKIIRDSNYARLMTDEEIKLYGPIIHKFNPNVRFRP